MYTSISVSYSCGHLTDQFGDHLVGCGHGSMGIHHHDALCDVIYHALLQDNSGCRRVQHHGPCLDCPDDVYHPDFTCGKPAYFDVIVRSSLQDSLLSQSAVSAGVTAFRVELEKDAHHEAEVHGASGIFIPLAVETLGLQSPASLKCLKEIAVSTTSQSGTPTALAVSHFLEQLSVILWRHNSRFFALFQFVASRDPPIMLA